MDKFWLVANGETRELCNELYLENPPKFMHETEESAEREALRLARLPKNKNETFIVLESKAYIEIHNGVPKWHEQSGN